MVSQRDLAREFADGAKSGKASNVSIHALDNGGTVLVGYGHAVYAYRSPSGHITTYMGWDNSSNIRDNSGTTSTKTQYGKMSLRSKADETVEGTDTDAAPKYNGFTPPQLA